MGQIEVYELLRNLRTMGDEAYYSVSEVEGMLKDRGHTNGVLHGVRGDLLRLELSGYLDIKLTGKVRDWRRLFRLKQKYVVQNTKKATERDISSRRTASP